MKFQELMAKSTAELTKDLKDLREELEQMAVKVKLGQLKNTNTIAQKRKAAAQILTALRQK
jgi:ribosomal protein L29